MSTRARRFPIEIAALCRYDGRFRIYPRRVPHIKKLVENNKAYAEQFKLSDLPARPAKKLAVLTCMDARIDVYKILGLTEGDAHVIRNAGGIVTEDSLRSIFVSERLLGTEEIILIQHTECGMLDLDEDLIRRQVRSEAGVDLPFDLGSITDLEGSVRSGIGELRRSAFIRDIAIHGFVYDVRTGLLSPVGE
jgi:carbonic anhydrase